MTNHQTSLLFKIKGTTSFDKHRILEMFFKSWVDDVCHNDVSYTNLWLSSDEEVYRVDFEYEEDAVILKLKAFPKEFQNHIEIFV